MGAFMASSTNLIFLYQTRTIFGPIGKNGKNLLSASNYQLKRLYASEPPASSTATSASNLSFLRRKSQKIAEQNQKSRSTLTRAERKAFEEAFHIVKKSSAPQDTSTSKDLETDIQSILDIFKASIQDDRIFDQERASSLGDNGVKHERTVSDNTFAQEPLSKDPSPSLKVGNQRAQPEVSSTKLQPEVMVRMGNLYLHQTAQSRSDTLREEDIQRIVQEGMEELSLAFYAALASHGTNGGVALWEVLQSRVFPMVKQLKQNSSRQKVGREHGTKEGQKEGENTESSIPAHETPITSNTPKHQPLSVITRLYPAALLLALRLYVKHFPTSPFPRALLPQIRSLGPASYVLGVNRFFYNTLILLNWVVYSNLREICNLLSEMERGGLELDQRTYGILVRIAEDRLKDLYGDQQTRGKDWWQRSEQVKWFTRLGEWRRLVATRLEEQGYGEVVQEGAYAHYQGHDVDLDGQLQEDLALVTGKQVLM